MSYILEALKKSEARRRDRQPPDLTETPPDTARGGRRVPVILATIVVLGAGSALGVWLATRADPDGALQTSSAPDGTGPAPEANAPETAGSEPETPTHVAVAERVRRAAENRRATEAGQIESPQAQNSAAREPATETRTADAGTGAAELAGQSASQAVPEPGPAPEPVKGQELGFQTEAEAGPEAGLEAGLESDPESEQEPQPVVDALAEDSPPAETDTAVASAEPPATLLDDLSAETIEPLETQAEPEAEAGSQLPLLHELSWGFRSQLPALALNVHMYSRDPAQRFVLINMQRYQEGDVMENSGILIRHVIPEGVVLQHAGRQFLLGR